MYQPFDKDEKCGCCNKLLNDIVSGKAVCVSCRDLGAELYSRKSVFSHLISALWELFNFRFLFCLAHLCWVFERIFSVGDYHPKTGKYHPNRQKDHIKD